MFFISFSTLWSLTYFFIFIYITVIFSILLYAIPSLKDIISYNKFKKSSSFDYLTGFDLYWIIVTPLFLFILVNFSWSSYSFSTWFGNIIFTYFQYKITFLIILFFYLIMTAYSTSFYFSSKEIYDYMITCFNFLFWILFIFFSNTIFTFIFFIEVISTLITLLLITSTFSTTYFYNNLNLNIHNYFSNTTPFFFVQMLMYFFWISLISSLNLFFFLILFYIKFLTFDWFFFEFIFFYIINLNQTKDFFFVFFIWFNLLFSIFLKCGLVPFYFWKPIFFKGIPMHALFFYIVFFYFFIFFILFFDIFKRNILFFFINKHYNSFFRIFYFIIYSVWSLLFKSIFSYE